MCGVLTGREIGISAHGLQNEGGRSKKFFVPFALTVSKTSSLPLQFAC